MSYIDETIVAVGYELEHNNSSQPVATTLPTNTPTSSTSKVQTTATVVQVPPDITAKIIDRILFQSGGVALGIIISAVGLTYLMKHAGVGAFVNKYLQKVDDASEVTKSLVNVLNNIANDLKDNHKEYVVQHSEINKNVDSVKETINSDLKPSIKNIERDVTKLIDKL